MSPDPEDPLSPSPQESAIPKSVSGAKSEAPRDTLSAEEQLERFAEELKFNDWGHQPN